MRQWLVCGLLALMVGVIAPKGAQAGPDQVDLALVLAVDISNSMDPDEQALQREGFVEGFRSPLVHDAIAKGMLGKIAVTYLEWAGPGIQIHVAPWTIIAGPADANAFADRLAAAPINRGPRTSISSAIDTSMRLLSEVPAEPLRRVIDISGDGANNSGRPVTMARDEALAKGISINGLPIMLKRYGGYFDIENLDEYYRDCVIGGVGAFMIPIRERTQFPEAVRRKLIEEIAGNPVPRLVVPTQAQGKANCMSGEIQADRWMRN